MLESGRKTSPFRTIFDSADQVWAVCDFSRHPSAPAEKISWMMLLGVVDREDQNLGSGSLADDFAERCKAIKNRHIQIQDDQVRT